MSVGQRLRVWGTGDRLGNLETALPCGRGLWWCTVQCGTTPALRVRRLPFHLECDTAGRCCAWGAPGAGEGIVRRLGVVCRLLRVVCRVSPFGAVSRLGSDSERTGCSAFHASTVPRGWARPFAPSGAMCVCMRAARIPCGARGVCDVSMALKCSRVRDARATSCHRVGGEGASIY